MKNIDIGTLRPQQPKGSEPHISFEIFFRGEQVQGQGGPYRQFFTDVTRELMMVQLKASTEDDDGGEAGENQNADDQEQENDQSSKQSQQKFIGLLIPSRNMQRDAGQGKDNLMINPKKTSREDLALYHFFGMLMGVCIHTSTNISIPLPSIVWK